jgi:hypothetical protein
MLHLINSAEIRDGPAIIIALVYFEFETFQSLHTTRQKNMLPMAPEKELRMAMNKVGSVPQSSLHS